MTTINDKIKNGEMYNPRNTQTYKGFVSQIIQDAMIEKLKKEYKTDATEEDLKEDIILSYTDIDIRKENQLDDELRGELRDIKHNNATIESVCDALKEFLLAKNKNYGNSATEPVRIFSKSNANEGILVRMDDKLSRIKNSSQIARNDATDLAGYLILLMKNNGWDNFMDMVD